VLDRRLRPVPVGVPGELWLGGPGVARGYLGRPALTAEKFIPDPFAGAGARMYRTGDRFRWLADGTLDFLGRLDQQVKVRGVRIEPAEVEAALRTHPAVRNAAVGARGEGNACRLVAWVAADPPISPAELREHLRGILPEALVPTAFVMLEALPLNRHGKVDGRALPDPEAPAAAAEHAAPRGEVERVLAAVWERVLNVPRVGADDSFFELGGDSLLSIQVVARARAAGVIVTPRQLFEHPTVAALARVARTGAAPAAPRGPVSGEAPLTPAQRRFFARELPDRHHFNMAVMVAPREPLEPAALAAAVAALLEHHDALRLRFTRRDGEWVQAHAPLEGADAAPLAVIDLSAVPPGERERRMEAEAEAVQRSLHLERGPLLRAAYFRPGGGEPGRLLLAVHHLVVDGVSWRVLLEDLEAAYEAARRGRPAALPPRTTSFREWAERLAAHAGAPETLAEAAYWSAAAQTPTAALPAAGGNGAGGDGAGADPVWSSLSAHETAALLREVPAAYRTQVNDVLLAALARAVARWTGERRLRVDLEAHGREELFEGVDLSRTVGWFTAVHPVVLELPAGGGEGDALKAVKEQLRAVPRHGVGYGLLRWQGPAEVREALARAPRPQVAFNYLGQFGGTLPGGGLLAFADDPTGPQQDPAAPREHLLEVVGAVRGDRLEVAWTPAPGALPRATVERLAGWYLDELRALIAHCLDEGAGGATPSDFSLVQIDADTLALLEADFLDDELEEAGGV
jgi:non-ribosomal peptide synthase protein (TIGR01720 family)